MSESVDDSERLRHLMQRELERARDDMARIAENAHETETELQDVAGRLSARETQLETVRTELAELRSSMTALTAENADLRKELATYSGHGRPGLLKRAIRKARRVTGKATRRVRGR